MRAYAILGILIMLALGIWHLERGAVARAEIGRMSDGIRAKDKSIALVERLAAEQAAGDRAKLDEAMQKNAELEARIARIPVVPGTGVPCPRGCDVQWPEF